MRKKGFTLAEVLGVIVIISLLLIIIVPSVINRITGTKDDAVYAGEDIVFKATDEYISEHPEDFPNGKAARYCITIKELLDEGKLVPTGMRDGKEIFVNSISGKDYTNLSVMVTIYSSGIRDYEIKAGDKCEELAVLPIIDFLVEPSGTAWVKQRVVTILYPKLEGYTYQYKIDDGKWTDAGSLNDYNVDYYSKELPAFTKISTLYARAKKDNAINGRIEISNIDSEKPVVRKVSVPSGWSNKNKTATATVYDGISGVKAYYLSTSSSKPSENSSGWKDVNYSKGEKTIKLNNLNDGTYYLWVKDKAGNINESNNKFTIDKIDTEKPKCYITINGKIGNNNWYKSEVKAKLNYSDNGGSKVIDYGIGTSSSISYNGKDEATQTADTKGITYYGYVKDGAGNTNQCKVSLKKDSTAPTCGTAENTSKKWSKKAKTIKQHCTDKTSGCEKEVYEKTYDNAILGTDKITDKAGNSRTCSYNVYVDTTPPVVDNFDYSYTSPIAICGNGWNSGNPQTLTFSTKFRNIEVHDVAVNGVKSDISHVKIVLAPVANMGNNQSAWCSEPSCLSQPNRYKLINYYDLKKTNNGHYVQSGSKNFSAKMTNENYPNTQRYCMDWCVNVQVFDNAGNSVQNLPSGGTGTKCQKKYNNSQGY